MLAFGFRSRLGSGGSWRPGSSAAGGEEPREGLTFESTGGRAGESRGSSSGASIIGKVFEGADSSMMTVLDPAAPVVVVIPGST